MDNDKTNEESRKAAGDSDDPWKETFHVLEMHAAALREAIGLALQCPIGLGDPLVDNLAMKSSLFPHRGDPVLAQFLLGTLAEIERIVAAEEEGDLCILDALALAEIALLEAESSLSGRLSDEQTRNW